MKCIKYFISCIFGFILFISNAFAITMAPVDITDMSIYDINDAIDDGYLTYETLFRLYLDRIDVLDDEYNAIISVNEDAIDEAKRCDKIYKKKGRSSELFCMPVIVKDNIDVKGMATTGGSKALSDSYPKSDATVIKNLKSKGMVVLAKANMSEFALKADSSKSSYGEVKNAYNTKYSSYGSSGGSATSVSLSYAPVALGTDTNSSLRAPSSSSNVVGFRSTFGLVDTSGVISYDVTRDVVGPITKTVKDNALVLEAMVNKKIGKYSNVNSDFLKNKNILVFDQFAYGDDTIEASATEETSSVVKTLFNNALKKMKSSGANIIHVDDFYSNYYQKLTDKTLGGWTMCSSFNKYIRNTSSDIKSFDELVSSKKTFYDLSDYVSDCSRSFDEIDDKQVLRDEYEDYIKSVIKKYDGDVIVYPTVKNKGLLSGDDDFYSASYTIAPMVGYPAISVPLGFDDDGLSYGIEFVSYKNKEKRLYNIASSFEKINDLSSNYKGSLYEIPSEVTRLKDLYESNKDRKDLSFDEDVLFEDIREFFVNYNSYDDKSKVANKLYNKYYNLNNNSFNYMVYIGIGLGIVFVICVIIVVVKRNRVSEEEIEIL